MVFGKMRTLGSCSLMGLCYNKVQTKWNVDIIENPRLCLTSSQEHYDWWCSKGRVTN